VGDRKSVVEHPGSALLCREAGIAGLEGHGFNSLLSVLYGDFHMCFQRTIGLAGSLTHDPQFSQHIHKETLT